ncbi:MAG: hypothetical protein FWE48_07360, partial [Coriobacteriia bacterium]|nr:hypothetical protein [Coriobacteriia bacterium]
HFYGNASAAGPCSACHGGDFMPPEPRYLTPRQEHLDEEGLAPGGMTGPGRIRSPFDPTPRRQLTPEQRRLLQENNIDLSLP